MIILFIQGIIFMAPGFWTLEYHLLRKILLSNLPQLRIAKLSHNTSLLVSISSLLVTSVSCLDHQVTTTLWVDESTMSLAITFY